MDCFSIRLSTSVDKLICWVDLSIVRGRPACKGHGPYEISFSSFLRAAVPLSAGLWNSSSPASPSQGPRSSCNGLSRGKENGITLKSKSTNQQPTSHSFADGCDYCSTFFTTAPSAQTSKPEKITGIPEDDDVDLEEFDLERFTAEEVRINNSMAEPGQRLQDAMTPKKVASSIAKPASRSSSTQISTLVLT